MTSAFRMEEATFSPRKRSFGAFRRAVCVGVLAGILSLLSGDWIAGLGVAVLFLGWQLLRVGDEPPVLALAFSFQWMQVMAGVYYYALTGRRLVEMDLADYRPMVLIGLGCLVALSFGIAIGLRLLSASKLLEPRRDDLTVSTRVLIVLYLASVAMSGAVRSAAWEYPGLTQGLLALNFARLGFLFTIFRRLARPPFRWRPLFVLVAAEILLGFSGYFAGFREVLFLAVLALLEQRESRDLRRWTALGLLAAAMLVTAVAWTGIKNDYRRDFNEGLDEQARVVRVERVASLVQDLLTQGSQALIGDVDAMVSRVWAVYYPALAFARVPLVIAHTDGEILGNALLHLVTPRILFPDKAELPSDSEMVRKYSGVMVAGSEQGTSIAFGYAAESYIDFGLPLMFVPVLVFGVLMGLAYRGVFRVYRHREIAVSVATVIFWISLYLFERSWVKTLGLTVTLLVYLGGAALVLDRLLLSVRATVPARRAASRPAR